MKINFSYTKQLLISNKAKLVLYVILLIVLGFISVKVGVINLLKDSNWRNPAILFSMISFVLGMIYIKLLGIFLKWQDKFQDKIEDNIRRASLGNEGEEILFGWAREIFNSPEYKLFPNFIIPGKNFDIDLIVIGPRGLFMFEVKNPANSIYFKDGEAFFMDKNNNPTSSRLPSNPLDEVTSHGLALIDYLKSNNFSEVIVHPCLVILGDKVIEGKSKIWIASDKESINQYILTKDFRYSNDFCEKLSRLF